MGGFTSPKWCKVALLELERRLPPAALASFRQYKVQLLQSFDLEARYAGLTQDGRIERQMILARLDELAERYISLSFVELCQRIYEWSTSALRGVEPGTVAAPDRAVAFRLEGIDDEITVRPGGVNAYLEEIAISEAESGPAPPSPVPYVSLSAPVPDFAKLEIRILAQQPVGYPVDLVLEDAALNEIQQYERGYLSPDILPWSFGQNWVEDGQRLFAALTADRHIMRAWDKAAAQAPQRRIMLNIDEAAPELHTLPWELLFDETLLSVDANTPLSRMMPASRPWGELITDFPARVLVVLANPAGLEEIGLASLSWDGYDTFGDIDRATFVFDFLESGASLQGVEQALRQGAYDIIHFIGHGIFDKAARQAFLYMDDERGQVTRVPDTALANIFAHLHRMERPLLAFLSACQSGQRVESNPFTGLGPLLGKVGVPAVVAMQDDVAVPAAQTLSRVFYERLATHGIVDRALNEARGSLNTQKLPGVTVPVLFTRLKAGRLWE